VRGHLCKVKTICISVFKSGRKERESVETVWMVKVGENGFQERELLSSVGGIRNKVPVGRKALEQREDSSTGIVKAGDDVCFEERSINRGSGMLMRRAEKNQKQLEGGEREED